MLRAVGVAMDGPLSSYDLNMVWYSLDLTVAQPLLSLMQRLDCEWL
jgi:hypothetical protein